ncbi:monovalent cation/H+ antiporter complex subunit F [Falsarthrobacter nasiphocae]|uniref:Multisubunit Na+/H+ antiporter MnhF subunit n=1 Tax=Falsarthrobacter nasiphocae TaxID=189863 RepID=A0AAE3YF69_9MICC|nr:monovalent cation/H+ antiporter complex subunit F [Falsarthrobacter nasiphocae]MDR6892289.1 multisubunit Na+/H+ antiporter MnhF subunit [Falsarthrobacter nasiphocae]
MSFLHYCTVLAGALLSVAALASLVRIQRGPRLLDRVIAVDVLVTVFVGALCVYMTTSKVADHLTLLLVLSVVAWVATLSFSIFLASRKENERS